MIKKLVLILLVALILPATAQRKKDKVLLTIENEAVYSSEFLRIFNKNKDVVSEENKKSITEYLDLFINYKLKLKEAHDIKLDTVKSYLSEFNKYKKQLVAPYLKDREVSNKLVREAYDRLKTEVKASHILIQVKPNASPKDTLTAYNTALNARNQVIKGEDFVTVAKKISQDPSAKTNGGDLGYFSAFSMVYAFENMAFNTTVGDVSMPFRTRFGYHVIKVMDTRASKGEVKVAHIMIRDKKNDSTYAKKQINDIYSKFKQGEKFELLVKKFSDDKSSAIKGGVIKKFSQGKMIQPFADISFELKNINDVSEPFKTKFGWHMVKLIEKFPVESFDSMKEGLIQKVEKGDRSVVIGKSITNKLRKKYHFSFNEDVFAKAMKPIASIEKGDIKESNEVVLFIEEESYKVSELKKYLKNKNKTYNDFIDMKITDYYKNHLEFEDKEFAATLQEYRDGLLLFDLLQKKIWTKAEKDTIGLDNFFTKNASKYNWKKRVKADIASCTKKEKAALTKKYMEQGKTIDEIKSLVNEGATIHVLFQSGAYELSSTKLPNNFKVAKGVKLYKDDDTHFAVVNVSEILQDSPKELKDVKGKVISEYQDYLEKQWIIDLHKKYNVTVDKRVLKKLVKKNS